MLRYFKYLLLSILFLPAALLALEFTPASPQVEAGYSRSLEISGGEGLVLWSALKGRIEGAGDRVLYTAPLQAGTDVVTVLDSLAQFAVLSITVTPSVQPPLEVSMENARWQIFSNRSKIQSIVYSEDGESLWIATQGGIEQRDPYSGEILQVLTSADGLPYNRIISLVSDGNNGFWAGTVFGLVHGEADGKNIHTIYPSESTDLYDDHISALYLDNQHGLWVGVRGSLLYRDADEQWQQWKLTEVGFPESDNEVNRLWLSADESQLWMGTDQGLAWLERDTETWQVFSPDNSPLQGRIVRAISGDDAGGVWIGLGAEDETGGLAHRDVNGAWSSLTEQNSDLPYNYIGQLLADGEGGLWVGMSGGGLAHLDADNDWASMNHYDSDLPNDNISVLTKTLDEELLIGMSGWDGGGLALFTDLTDFSAGEIQVLDTSADRIPDNEIQTILVDSQGGTWIGAGGFLLHILADESQVLFDQSNSPLPVNDTRVMSLLEDVDNGGMWVATLDNGLFYRGSSGDWQQYTVDNSGLPSNQLYELLHDNEDGFWITTKDTGLVHFDALATGAWTVYNQDNTGFPNNRIQTLLLDEDDAVWLGFGLDELDPGIPGGLARRDQLGNWTFWAKNASTLPDDDITALLMDGVGGLWIGTRNQGLLHWNDMQQMQAHFQELPEQLPGSSIQGLMDDGNGGLWIAVYWSGLAHRSNSGVWTHFDNSNSQLPDESVAVLSQNVEGGLWLGTQQGLAMLNFGEKNKLLRSISEQSARDSLLQERRAALIIHPSGSGSGYNQAAAVDFMATYAYRSLSARGYDNDEIYFLSYKPDIDVNGDGQSDLNVIDAPVTLTQQRTGTPARDLQQTDIEIALRWAKNQGSLDQPLVVLFIDHGLPESLLLDPQGLDSISAQALDALLDDYQQTTGNSVVVVLEACHTGTVAAVLSDTERLVISSTDAQLAYYDDLGRLSFLKLFFDQLRQGENYQQARETVAASLSGLRWPLNQQQPQLYDEDGQLSYACLNGCFGGLPGLLTLTVEPPPSVVAPGQSLPLQVATHIGSGSVRNVWASLSTPEVASQRNEFGYSRNPTPNFYLRRSETGDWQGNIDAFNYQGDYQLTVKAEDNSGFITESPSINLKVESGIAIQGADFDANTGLLHVPVVTLANTVGGTDYFQVDLLLEDRPDGLLFNIDAIDMLSGQPGGVSYANFELSSGLLYVPDIQLSSEVDGPRYNADLQLMADGGLLLQRLGQQ
ncbi:two-component regulator propeller domain-containing protein [Candidatus Venteria ishoeyi]|uniref:ligand-binding sensor domain-containing protein n=1 Tax=Candidatus Venteria ishoeyi TaxID=1899563 RepID=UPI0025A5717C|nr:two-component regulator propeller domain-containing protein [Candidatus Venteria ishoeyi]MDM8544978.1 two-component regulator propeller domain-containing protein [Candidatus Venteria ishoeyi]